MLGLLERVTTLIMEFRPKLLSFIDGS